MLRVASFWDLIELTTGVKKLELVSLKDELKMEVEVPLGDIACSLSPWFMP